MSANNREQTRFFVWAFVALLPFLFFWSFWADVTQDPLIPLGLLFTGLGLAVTFERRLGLQQKK